MSLEETEELAETEQELPIGAGIVIRSIVACLIGTFILRMAASVMGNMLQLYFGWIDANEYPLSNTLGNIATAIFFFPELVGSPVLGSWSDRYGRKPFIMIGPLSGAIAVQLTAMTSHLGVLMFTRLLEGLSTASAIPATLGYLSAATSDSPSLRGKVMGIFEVATIGGTLAGVLIGGRMWDLFGRSAFTLDSGIYLLSLTIFFLGMLEVRSRIQRAAQPQSSLFAGQMRLAAEALGHTWTSLRSTLKSPRILRFAPAWLAINMILGAWFNTLIRQLVAPNDRFPDQLLYGIFAESARAGTQVSIYAALVMAVFAIGVVAWSFTFSRFRRTSVMLVGTAGLFVLCAFLFALNHVGSPLQPDAARLAEPTVPFFAAGAILALMVVSGFTPAALTYLADVTEDDPSQRGTIMGLYSVFFGVGQFFGTLIGGPFADWRGVDGLIIVTALLGLLATWTLLRLHRAERHE